MTYLINFDEILIRYKAGERDFHGVECQGKLDCSNLSDIDLSGAIIHTLSLTGSNFTGANLTGAKITGCDLTGTNFTNANLSGVNFCRRELPGYSSYSPSPQYLSHLTLANLEQANLTQADLEEIWLIDANLRHANLEGANLTKADLRGANLIGANLVSANLTGANLCQANLTDAVLSDTTLQKALLGWTVMPNGSISHSPAMDLIANKFAPLKRTAWKPITIRGDGGLSASKFAGKPWINECESYPICEYCQTPLRFFFQLNLSKLPTNLDGQFGDGLLQLFYCTNHESGCDGGDVTQVQIIHPTKIPAQLEIPEIKFDSMSALIDGEFPARQIVGWQAIDDYPSSWNEVEKSNFLAEFGFNEDEFKIVIDTPNINGNERLFKFDQSEFDLYANYINPNNPSPPSLELKKTMQRTWTVIDFMELTRMRPLEGDKLSGHPDWHQGEEFPNCPNCNKLMDRLIFQFASDDNIPYLWGDCGTGYILQCPDCKDKVTFLHQE